MTVRLHVNVDHVATVRNARGTHYPDPLLAAAECIQAGANGITAHLREDRRHIVDEDVERLRALLTKTGRTFNLEMAPTTEMVGIAARLRPDTCTLVPERREERTTEGGLDVVAGGATLARRVHELHDSAIRVSLFIAADTEQIQASARLSVTQIELHTGEYAQGKDGELTRIAEGAKRARILGLEVAAGHGLTQTNVPALVAIPEIVELNIGHALVADAIFVGMREAVKAYRAAMARGRGFEEHRV